MNGLSEDMVKEALKAGLKEWLDDQYSLVGKWFVGAILVGVVMLMVKFGTFR